MRKRLPFLPAVIIGLTVSFLGGAIITLWLKWKFELPYWIIPLSTLISLFLAIEIVGLLGPAQSDTPILKFLGLSIRDKIVTVTAVLAFVLIAFPLGYRYESVLLPFLFSALGLVALWLICFIFGSQRLRRFMLLLLKKPE